MMDMIVMRNVLSCNALPNKVYDLLPVLDAVHNLGQRLADVLAGPSKLLSERFAGRTVDAASYTLVVSEHVFGCLTAG